MTEDRQLIESLLTEGEENREAGDWGAAKICYLKAMDELHARLEEDRLGGGTFIEEEDKVLKKKLEEACITIDGIRINFDENSWGAVRASNTSPNLTLRFEAPTKTRLKEIQAIMVTELKKYPQVSLDWYKA